DLVTRFWRECTAQRCRWWCLCCNKWLCWLLVIIVAIVVSLFIVIFVLTVVFLLVVCELLCIIATILHAIGRSEIPRCFAEAGTESLPAPEPHSGPGVTTGSVPPARRGNRVKNEAVDVMVRDCGCREGKIGLAISSSVILVLYFADAWPNASGLASAALGV